MCDTCGCEGDGKQITFLRPGELRVDSHAYAHEHGLPHVHDHGHSHSHQNDHVHDRKIVVETDVLQKNNLLAERNRGYFEARQIFAINLMSSPGSGKTTLLEKTILGLKDKKKIAVIEGDQQTLNDAIRIESAGAPAVQVNTGNGCHLDSSMIRKAMEKLNLEETTLLFIENVGNLVCPSLFDLGESKRVVIISVAEGDDKPAKYPTMFERADLVIINKTDLLPYVDFDVQKAKNHATKINPHLEFITLSARSGEGMSDWYAWLNRF
jgi:hydrogenase nickel incorporation protein HypB